jgi:hypothetical protein
MNTDVKKITERIAKIYEALLVCSNALIRRTEFPTT